VVIWLLFVDKASLQNVLNATKVLINPDIEEVVKFKEGYVVRMGFTLVRKLHCYISFLFIVMYCVVV
jgi:hypothetical protein